MSLTQSDRAIDEQGIIGSSGGFADSVTGGVGQAVAGTDHEVVKGVVRTKVVEVGVERV